MDKPAVCCIIPPSSFLLDERVFVSLGILKVAAALEMRGHAVEVLDLSGVANYADAARAHAAQTKARHFALTATTPQMPAAANIAAALRGALTGAKLIIGGPHPTVTLAACKKEIEPGRASRALAQLRDMFDVVVAGDGEDAVFAALQPRAHGVIDADDPKGPLFLTNKRLAETPWPARHLVDLGSYHYKVDGFAATSLVAQLGCPFGCAFCGGRASPMLRRIRTRSTEQVVAELEHVHKTYGHTGFMFYDDELNVNPKVVELMRAIAALQQRLGVEFRLRGFVKAELFTQEQAYAMRAAGFRWLLCGFESGHPRILENIQKKATVADNDNMLLFARTAGLKVKALMSIGHAGESAETVEATKQWLLSRHVDDFDCTIITPYPGSPYYDEAAPNNAPVISATHNGDPEVAIWTYYAPGTGDRLHQAEIDYFREADYYKGAPGGGYVSHVFTDHLTPEDLVRLRDELERDVRAELGIPFNPGAPGVQFEASMGMTRLPPTILRSSEQP